MSEYPEHDKLHAVAERSQAIGEFIDFGGYVLSEWRDDLTDSFECLRCGPTHRAACRHCGGTGFVEQPISPRLMPVGKPIAAILAGYFGIDEAKLEAEKRAMLDALRERHN